MDRTATRSHYLFRRRLDDFVLLHAHRQKLHRLSRLDGQLALAIQAAPVEHHVRVQSMSTSHSRNACARLQGLLHNQPLLSSGTTLPDLPDKHPRSFHQLIVRPASAHAKMGRPNAYWPHAGTLRAYSECNKSQPLGIYETGSRIDQSGSSVEFVSTSTDSVPQSGTPQHTRSFEGSITGMGCR